MKNVLIIPAPIASHILPTFHLSRQMQNEHLISVTYLVESLEHFQLVTQNGFKAKIIKTVRFGIGGDNVFYKEHNRTSSRYSFYEITKIFLSLKGFYSRKEELLDILTDINPTSILIDVFSSTDYLVIKSMRTNHKIFFVNPMTNSFLDNLQNYRYRRRYTENKSHLGLFFRTLIFVQRFLVYVKTDIWRTNGFIHMGSPVLRFKEIPEIILAPVEFEVQQTNIDRNRIYSGLNVDIKRQFFEDGSISELAIEIQSLREANKKIIYCSFGMYYTSKDHLRISAFLIALSLAVEGTNIHIFISANMELESNIKLSIQNSHNISTYVNLPQIKILPYVDAFLSHGGLGSIKESVFFEKPLVIYPLDYQWDQYANGIMVKKLDIGIMGNLDNDEVDEIQRSLIEIIDNPRYKSNIASLNYKIQKTNDNQFISSIIEMFS